MPKYFVKFVKFNVHTVENLINKQIKFSTVYEFNDFNELSFLGNPVPNDKISEIIITELKDYEKQSKAIKQAEISGNYTRSWFNDLRAKLHNFNNTQDPKILSDVWSHLMEYLVFNYVGIYCVSELCIFKDDSAQLMFAHYGDNLKGLALVYEIKEIDDNKNKINYINAIQKDTSTEDITNKFINYRNGNFDDMKEFKRKSNKWGYEKEYRLFNTPQLHFTEERGIKLKAILYTPRFPQEQIQVLKRINTAFYEEKLECKEIYPSITEYKFKLEDENVCEWLIKNLKD